MDATDRVIIHINALMKHAVFHFRGIAREVGCMPKLKVAKKVKDRLKKRKEQIKAIIGSLTPEEKEQLRRFFFAALCAGAKFMEEYSHD